MFFSPRYHVHGFASVIVGNQEKKQPHSLPSITCGNFNIMVVFYVHCKALSKTAVWNIIIPISCYISNRSICYAYIMQINNIINYQLLERWSTLCRYFRVKFFWKRKQKTETNKRKELLNIWWNFFSWVGVVLSKGSELRRHLVPMNSTGHSNTWTLVAH